MGNFGCLLHDAGALLRPRGIAGSILKHGRPLAALCVVAIALSNGMAAAQVTFSGSQFNVASGAFAAPRSVAVDSKGNVYIADSGNNRVVSIVPSSNGDAAPTTLVSGLSGPAGVAADWSGNVYVSDTGNNRVLMVPLAQNGFGDPVTVGTGLSGPTGIAVDSLGNLYVADTGNNRVVELPRIGNGFGSLTVIGTGLNSPAGVAVDASRNLYIADTGNNRVVKEPFTTSGYTTQQVLKGNVASPMSVAVDRINDLYIAETGSGQILEEPWSVGADRYNAQMVIGSGFASPAGVSVDLNGNAYVADAANDQVIEVMPGSVNFGALNTYSTAATLTYNFSVSAGTIVGAVSVSTQGITGKDFMDAGGSTCTAQTYTAATNCGVSVAFTPLGTGLRMGAVVLYGNQGNTLATAFLSGTGMQPQAAFVPGTETQLGAQLSGPSGVAVDAGGNVYIADTGNNRVVEVAWTGSGYGAQTTLPLTGLNTPMGLAVDGAGNLYITSNGNDKVVKLAWTGTGFGIQTKVGVSFYGPSAAAVDGGGNAYVADTLDNRIYKLPWTGSSYAEAISLGNYTKNPTGIAVDESGNIYFTEPYMNDLAEVPESGSVYQTQTYLQLEGISLPTALAVDRNSNLYILDTGNNRVLMLPWTGSSFEKQITVASGFNAPGGMALDGNGNLYVADTGNNQVVKIDLSAPAAMSFANTYLGSTSKDSARVALVVNIGNQPLELSAVSYPVDFPENAGAMNLCDAGTSVSQGNTCELAVDFTPVGVGSPLTEVVSVTDNALSLAGTQQSITVAGTSVARLSQTISFSPISSTSYGAAPIALFASASSGLPITYQVVSGPAVLNNATKLLSLRGAGMVVVTVTQAGNSVYVAAAVTQSFLVAPAILTVAPVSATAVYGNIPVKFNYTLAGFMLGQNAAQVLTGQPAIESSASSNSGAGIYTLTASSGSLSAANYSFIFAGGTLTVNKAVLTVTAASQSMTYGGALSALTYAVKGFVNGDTQSGSIAGSPQLAIAVSGQSGAGKYAISAGAGTLSAANYSFVFTSGTLTVNKAVLTVTAVSQSMTYGEPMPSMTYVITGFVGGDTQSNSVAGTPPVAAAAAAKPGAGKYAINVNAGTLSAANYSFIFVPGSLTVNKSVLTVTAATESMTYGGVLPAMVYVVSGFVNGDTKGSSVFGGPGLTTATTSNSAVGEYAIGVGVGTLWAANYTFACVSGTLTVNRAVLTVAAVNQSMTYGAAVPAMTYSVKGFVGGDTQSSAVAGLAQLATAVTGQPGAGKYAINTGVGTLSAANYSFALVNGTLTVAKAALTVTAVNASMTYGGNIPVITYSVKGFVNGDTQSSSIAGAPQLTTSATSMSAAGQYTINAGIGTLSAANYSFEFAPGSLVVNTALLTVAAANQSMTYGGALPSMTYAITGFVNGDSSQSAVKGAAAVTTPATDASAVGQYAITAAVGSLAAKNYSFAFQAGSLTVNPAPLTVTANNLSTVSGQPLPALSYSVSGWVDKDTQASAASGAPSLSTTATVTSAAGTYTITAQRGTMNASNYTLTFVNGVLTVTSQSGGSIVHGPIALPAPWQPKTPSKGHAALPAP